MRYVKISDLLDGLEAPDLELRETPSVSADRIRALALKQIRAEARPRRGRLKRPAAVVLAASLALVMSVTAAAAITRGSFFNSVFGKGIAGQEAYTDVLSDGSDGTTPKTENYPAVERVDVDEEMAEALVGAYVTAVGQSVTLENYTFTVEDVLLDENGIGAITVHVENPEGHKIKRDGQYIMAKGEKPPFTIQALRQTGEHPYMDERDYLVEDSFTDTEAAYVYYITPFEELPEEEALTLVFRLITDDDPPEWPEASIAIPALDKIPTRDFSAGGISAGVSPVGMTLRYSIGTDGGAGSSDSAAKPPQSGEKIESGLVIRYKDGSEYVVEGDGLINISLSSVSQDGNTKWIAFNRLADVDNIAEIQIAGHWTGSGEITTPYALTLTGAD